MTLLLVLLCLVGCRSEEPAARGIIAQTPASEMYATTQEALRTAGITQLTWGVTPYVTSDGDVEDRYRPMVKLVSERIATPIEVIAGQSYEDVETLLLSGQIDVAVMSPYAYVRAQAKDKNIRAIASHIANGTESYGAYILAREESAIQQLADLKGKRFGFVDKRSSSGWLFPASRMLDEGINPLTEVSGRFYGNHARVIAAIASGEVDAGATYNAALREGRGAIRGAKNLRVIARTERIPYDAYVVRSGFPTEAILGLQKAISSVSTRDSTGREALEPLGDINGFIRVSDSHYRRVRDTEDRVRSLLDLPGGKLPDPMPAQEDTGP